MLSVKIPDRDGLIIEAVLDGQTLKSVAEEYNLSRNRIHQIVRGAGRRVIQYNSELYGIASSAHEIRDHSGYKMTFFDISIEMMRQHKSTIMRYLMYPSKKITKPSW